MSGPRVFDPHLLPRKILPQPTGMSAKLLYDLSRVFARDGIRTGGEEGARLYTISKLIEYRASRA
jgi:hypothetical protein